MNIERKARSIRSTKDTQYVKQLFDIKTLDFYCRYVISANQNIRVSGLNLVKELFDKVDPDSYGNDIERINRIEFIKRGLEARLVKKINNRDLIIQYINGGLMNKPLLDTDSMEEISDETLSYLIEQAAELSKSYFVDGIYDEILKLSTDLKNANYRKRADVIRQIQSLTAQLNMKFNKLDDATNASPMFTLVPGEFEASLADTYSRETSPSKILKTGLTGLNMMLGGGIQANRVYILFAQAAGGKSFTMIDLAMQIKHYNRDYVPHDPTKIPTIVFLTMENSSDENVSRMMGMIDTGTTFSDHSFEESVDIFRNGGLGYDKEKDPIDIVMIYKPNLSVNTDYLYTLTDKLREMGREPICIFQDHIKRIRPVNKHNDMRLDLGEIVNEFKAFANYANIPVITDSHLNREASKTLDDSSGNNKKDLIRSLGSFNVSESYLMIDNCDVGIIINKEMDSLSNLYMGFKCIKTRTKCYLDLFYQPYESNNDIKLVEDFNAAIPSFKSTLKEDNKTPQSFNSRMSRRTDFKTIDDDELFSAKVLGNTEPPLLPDNNNQDKFVISGAPSEPVFPMNSPIQSTVNPIMASSPLYAYGIQQAQQPSQWDLKLLDMKYKSMCTPAVVFLDSDGLVVNDGIEDII